jgi:hypothetical protein
MLEVTNAFTVEDMRRFAGEAWGAFGINVVELVCRASNFKGTIFAIVHCNSGARNTGVANDHAG